MRVVETVAGIIVWSLPIALLAFLARELVELASAIGPDSWRGDSLLALDLLHATQIGFVVTLSVLWVSGAVLVLLYSRRRVNAHADEAPAATGGSVAGDTARQQAWGQLIVFDPAQLRSSRQRLADPPGSSLT